MEFSGHQRFLQQAFLRGDTVDVSEIRANQAVEVGTVYLPLFTSFFLHPSPRWLVEMSEPSRVMLCQFFSAGKNDLTNFFLLPLSSVCEFGDFPSQDVFFGGKCREGKMVLPPFPPNKKGHTFFLFLHLRFTTCCCVKSRRSCHKMGPYQLYIGL